MRDHLKALLATAALAAGVPHMAQAAAATPAVQAVQIGQCLVKADRFAAISLLGRLPTDGSAADLSAAGSCSAGATAVSALQLRGGIAEALYERDFREAGIRPHQPVSQLAQIDLPQGAADTGGMFTISTCVAQKRFADVDKLFATPAGSDREDRFIEGLMPYFSICQPRGTRIAIKRGDIRPLVAQAAYAENVRYWRFQAASR